jgi:hypothetical protein
VASPARIFAVYRCLHEQAATVREFQVARGERVSGTVEMLLAGDRERFLRRWGEEIDELCAVLDGQHDDPYNVEATQCFYWASLFAVSGGVDWPEIAFEALRHQVPATRIDDTDTLRKASERLVALGPERALPAKLFLLWCVADGLYRSKTQAEQQWSLEQIMEYDLQDMKKRAYLQPCLKATESH